MSDPAAGVDIASKEPWSVHWIEIVGLAVTAAFNDWSALVDPISARSQPSIPHTSLHLETSFPGHITRTSLFPPFSSPWPTLEPKQRPRGRSHRRRQIIKVLILRSAKGHLPLTLAGNRPQGIRPRKGSSRKRATRRAERNRLRPTTPSETPTPQVCPLSFVLYGSQTKLGHGIHRNNRRLSRAEVASASTQSNTHSRPAQTQTQTRSDSGHHLHALQKTHLASQRLAAAPTNTLTRLLSGRRKGAGQRSRTGRKRSQRRFLPWNVYLHGRNPRPTYGSGPSLPHPRHLATRSRERRRVLPTETHAIRRCLRPEAALWTSLN